MDTVYGYIDLSHTYSCNTEIFDIDSGGRTQVLIEKRFVDFLRFFTCPFCYSLAKNWKIVQPGGNILVGDLPGLVARHDSINKRIGRIFNKFNKQKDFILISEEKGWFGLPACNRFFDRDLIIVRE